MANLPQFVPVNFQTVGWMIFHVKRDKSHVMFSREFSQEVVAPLEISTLGRIRNKMGKPEYLHLP
jgi:hypothetical protein